MILEQIVTLLQQIDTRLARLERKVDRTLQYVESPHHINVVLPKLIDVAKVKQEMGR